jgi:hypothetical protein
VLEFASWIQFGKSYFKIQEQWVDFLIAFQVKSGYRATYDNIGYEGSDGVNKMKKYFLLLVVSVLLLLTGFAGIAGAQQEIPKATSPGFPTVGMLEQHMSEGIGNFVEVDRIWNDSGDLVRFYFNSHYVKHDVDKKIITVWFLEEYTPQGRDISIANWKSQGIDVESLKDFKFRYFQVSLSYADPWGQAYEYPQQYEFAIAAGGEVCDSKMKVVYLMQSTPFQKLTLEENMHFIHLGEKLQDWYNLK